MSEYAHPPHLANDLSRSYGKANEAFRRCKSLNERRKWVPPETNFKGEWEGYHSRAERQSAQWRRKHSKRVREAGRWIEKAFRQTNRMLKVKKNWQTKTGPLTLPSPAI